MNTSDLLPPASVAQGFSDSAAERLPLMAREAMSAAQRDAADALIAGPRKAVFGPFIPCCAAPNSCAGSVAWANTCVLKACWKPACANW